MANPFLETLDNRGPFVQLEEGIFAAVIRKHQGEINAARRKYAEAEASGDPELLGRVDKQLSEQMAERIQREKVEFYQMLAEAIAKAMQQGEVSKAMRSGATNNPFAPPGTGGSGPTPRHGTPVRAHGRTSCRGNEHSVRSHIRNG